MYKGQFYTKQRSHTLQWIYTPHFKGTDCSQCITVWKSSWEGNQKRRHHKHFCRKWTLASQLNSTG